MEGSHTWTWVLLQLLAGLVVLSVVLLGAATLYLTYIYRKYAHIPSPPRGSFFLGHASTLKDKLKNGIFFSEIILQFAQQYGHTFVIFIIGQPLVITVDQEAVKELLVTGNFSKSKNSYERLGHLYGERFISAGLVTETDNEKWSKMRARVNPAFHRQLLRTLMAEFNQTGDDLMELLAEQADGKSVITMLDSLNRVTLDVIGKVAFSMDINSIKEPSSPLSAAIFKALHGFSSTNKTIISHKIPFMDVEYKREVRNAVKFLRETGRKVLEQREIDGKKGLPLPTDVISFVIAARKEDPSFSMEEVLDNFVTLFIAGQETTANLLAFVIRELGRYPDILQRLREEVEEVVGERHEVSFEDINKLEYCTRVIKETLRLLPPVPLTFRKIDRDYKVGGFVVPKGTTAVMSTYASSRIEEFTPDVLTFDPDRFLPDSKKKPPTYAYFPFSLGPRNCIGMTFAQIEAKVILVKFIQRFNFELDPTQSFGIEENTTLRPKDGTRLTLTERDL